MPGAGEERDDLGDVLGRAEPLERREPSRAIDRLLVFAVEEQLRRGWSRRDCVGSDVAAAQLP
jgi:hypothetical protein